VCRDTKFEPYFSYVYKEYRARAGGGTAVGLANRSLGTELIAVHVRTNHISGERDLLTDQESLDE